MQSTKQVGDTWVPGPVPKLQHCEIDSLNLVSLLIQRSLRNGCIGISTKSASIWPTGWRLVACSWPLAVACFFQLCWARGGSYQVRCWGSACGAQDSSPASNQVAADIWQLPVKNWACAGHIAYAGLAREEGYPVRRWGQTAACREPPPRSIISLQ